MPIRLVTFDALHTIITPRLPIYVQYSRTFEPYLGVLAPDALKTAFKVALKQMQVDKPVYKDGVSVWWGEVVRRTAVGAGADPHVVDSHLGEIVPRLLHRFSSKEGYQLYDDTFTCLQQLTSMDVRTGLVSNTDARMRNVLTDLGVTAFLDPLLVSGEEGVEKPSREIFRRACSLAGVVPRDALHVGDDLYADYFGAREAGMHSLLIRRPGPAGEEEAREDGEELVRLQVVACLQDVVGWVRQSYYKAI